MNDLTGLTDQEWEAIIIVNAALDRVDSERDSVHGMEPSDAMRIGQWRERVSNAKDALWALRCHGEISLGDIRAKVDDES